MNTGTLKARAARIGMASGLATLAVTGCVDIPRTTASPQPTLKEAFEDSFLIGAALNAAQFTGEHAAEAALAAAQFNSITPENVLKWECAQPDPGRFDFDAADRFVEFGETNGQFIVGHTLVWHQQTPRWVFRDEAGAPLDREGLLERMREHIHTVVGRYKGRIQAWDVVNEALNEDGTLRQSPWFRIIGEDYIAQAFRFAHEADPSAQLYYNDYALENEPKRRGAIALIRNLQAAGVPIDGIGTQQHARMDWPTAEEVDATLRDFGQLGVQVMVTELDVSVLPEREGNHSADVSRREAADPALNPYPDGLPATVQQALAERYAGLFKVYLKHRDSLSRVTFWGVTDLHSWRNGWPIRGRTDYPLLFDRNGRPKPAFQEVIRTAGQ
jgi:endo-1,4-beta-xylanase